MTPHPSPSSAAGCTRSAFDKPTIPWTTFGEHLEFLSDVGHTPNFAWFVGHNAIRLAAGVSGPTPTSSSGDDGGFVHEAMQSGALGLSTGSSSTRAVGDGRGS